MGGEGSGCSSSPWTGLAGVGEGPRSWVRAFSGVGGWRRSCSGPTYRLLPLLTWYGAAIAFNMWKWLGLLAGAVGNRRRTRGMVLPAVVSVVVQPR